MAKTSLGLFLALVLIMNYGNAIWIEAKAELAQLLIRYAWASSLHSGEPHKPWNWADTWPVARIRHPASQTDLYVLEGDAGQALAFGPGRQINSDSQDSYLSNSYLPSKGPSIIGGHRNTHFEFLKEARLRDELLIQGMDGIWMEYEITDMQIRDSEKQMLIVDSQSNNLYLITCYPFDALLPGGTLRYLVTAVPKQPLITPKGLNSLI